MGVSVSSARQQKAAVSVQLDILVCAPHVPKSLQIAANKTTFLKLLKA